MTASEAMQILRDCEYVVASEIEYFGANGHPDDDRHLIALVERRIRMRLRRKRERLANAKTKH